MGMSSNDLMKIRARLRIAWENIMPDADSISTWYDTFKQYDFQVVENAAIEYMKRNKYKPNPADIIACIPAAFVAPDREVIKFVPKYETMPDGRVVRVIQCRRCRDTGLITWCDDEGRWIGRPCTCAAAVVNFGVATRAEAVQ